MTVDTGSPAAVRLAPGSVSLNGTGEILLCASLFYFRIPRALWRKRMMQLKALGYNAIDVYFPWNYHEREEGVWDFSEERDAEAFLRMAADEGLRVVARPGPYICSEWDGGGLPAYLLAVGGIRLRDNEPLFLSHAARWFERILPLLRQYELGAGGTIVAVQLDNELDFYGCSDPQGYMSALRDMALRHGIRVPLIACAGQGGLAAAGGDAAGIVPTCNFYPDNRDPEFETLVLAYHEELARRGLPLLVTETNRSHFLLRRLLSCGVKLLGPYLQVSGTDAGFTNAINNWGRPMAFMTSDYDFGGMLSPEGEVREEGYEARLLSRVLRLYGEQLAEAMPQDPPGEAERTAWLERGFDTGPYRLGLREGGRLAFVSDTSRELCLILPEEVSLTRWGIEGRIVSSAAELCAAVRGADGSVLVFHSPEGGQASIALSFDETPAAATADEDGCLSGAGTAYTVILNGATRSRCEFVWADGVRLTIWGLPRREALLLADVAADEPQLSFAAPAVSAGGEPAAALTWSATAVEAHMPFSTAAAAAFADGESLEACGIYRGYAWYEYDNMRDEPPLGEEEGTSRRRMKGWLIARASDIVSLYADAAYVGTFVPGGSGRYVPLAGGEVPARVSARVEIWGHSNFDDPRLPALRLHATKGIGRLTAVTSERDLTSGWRYARTTDAAPDPQRIAASADDERWPLTRFGGWHPNDPLTREYYRRTVTFAPGYASRTLWLDDLESRVDVFVDGEAAGSLGPGDPWLPLDSRVGAEGGVRQLTLVLERRIGAAPGRPVLLEGQAAVLRGLSSAAEREMLDGAALAERGAVPAMLPYSLAPGGIAWLYAAPGDPGDGDGWRVFAEGANVKLTVFAGDRLVARLWLPGGDERPVMSGGSPDSFYVPAAWLEGTGARRMAVLLEAVVPGQAGELRALRLLPV